MKKIFTLLLTFSLLLGISGCGFMEPPQYNAEYDYVESTYSDESTSSSIEENGWYYSAEDVSLYLYTYGELPENFITKSEARELGWEGGSVETVAPGYAIGGDRFGNREGLLPNANERTYYECDIDTYGKTSRGAKRNVYSSDGLIFYTEAHYESFVMLYGENAQ